MSPENSRNHGGQRRRGRSAQASTAITRRNFLKIAGVGAAGTLAVLYLKYKGSEKPGSEYPEIQKYYPEMSDHPVKKTFSFTTTVSENQIRAFNFTDVKVDEIAAKKAFDFWENVARNHIEFSYLTSKNRLLGAKVLPDIRSSNTLIFIVDKSSPRPFWDTTQNDGITFKGFFKSSNPINITVIRLEPLEGKNDEYYYENSLNKANHAFLTEMCQTSVYVESNPPKYQMLTQEVFCNTTSGAVLSRLMGRPYTKYADIGSKIIIDFSSTLGETFSANTLTENEYLQLPVLPPVFIEG